MLEYAHAIVGDAVKYEDPIAVGVRGTHLPSAKQHAIGSAYIELITMHIDLRENRICMPDQVRCEFSPQWMHKSGADQPANRSREYRRKQEKKQTDAD